VNNAGADQYEKIAQTLLDGLRPKLKAAFVLREVDGRDYNEVAKALGTSQLTARVRVSRARTEIQKRYKRCLTSTGWRELL
jgi:RNA polymerase sigma factor (sigma-70 family)